MLVRMGGEDGDGVPGGHETSAQDQVELRETP